jgi:hypothetical protein
MPTVNIQDKFIVRGTGGGGISAPSNVSISSKTSSGFTVSWNAVASAIGYKLDVSTDSGFTSFVSGYNGKDVAGTSEAVTGLTQNTTYYTRVRAVAASSNSSSVSDTTEVLTLLNPGLLSGLLAFYKLDDTTDASGNGNTLTNNGGVTFSSGKIGNAADLNGSNWLVANPVGISGRDLSVFCWVKTSGGSYNFIISADKSGEQWGNIMTQPGGNYFLEYFLDGTYRNIASGTQINTDTWKHVGFTSSSSANQIKLYVDGSVVATEDISGYSGSFGNGTTGIGANWSGVFAQVTGQIDAVGIWNRPLNGTEVSELYNSGSGLE